MSLLKKSKKKSKSDTKITGMYLLRKQPVSQKFCDNYFQKTSQPNILLFLVL